MQSVDIPQPQVPVVDMKTGLINREWWRFFHDPRFATVSGSGALPPNGLDGQLVVGLTGIDPEWRDVNTDATLDNTGALVISPLAVTTGKINDLAVTTAKIADLAVTTPKLAALSVTTAKINDLAVTAPKIDALAVTTPKIDDLAVTTAKINDLAVTTAKINDLGVTTGKINDLAVTTGKIAANAVTNAKLAQMTTRTIKGNNTGGTADPSDLAAGQFPATQTNDSAAAGNLGEYISSTLASGAAVALTTATAADITTIALTPGDWDVTGQVDYALAAATATNFKSGSSDTSATFGAQDTSTSMPLIVAVVTDVYGQIIPTVRISINANTTIYLVAQATFSVGGVSAYGTIRARRIR